MGCACPCILTTSLNFTIVTLMSSRGLEGSEVHPARSMRLERQLKARGQVKYCSLCLGRSRHTLRVLEDHHRQQAEERLAACGVPELGNGLDLGFYAAR